MAPHGTLAASSAAFGRWVGERLSADNHKQLWVPPGFAHGFVVLSEFAEVQYKCSAVYNPKTEAGIMWNDPDLAVQWPLNGIEPLLSDRDKGNQTFAEWKKTY